ncbi:odorant receptor 59a-like [Lucilia sericata]|uniref:odorant receptor 59a-like n=1 Tax=Lucilia sericata TaxID=13632 RepID=UPI0018A802D7|nr:odorant receptor 59a-like [Lucilia sericata]
MTTSTKGIFLKTTTINCCKFFIMNWKCWKWLGIIVPDKSEPTRFKQLTWNYFINITVSCMFPIHLMLGIFLTDATKSELFENIAIFITSVGCILKLIMFAVNIKRIRRMENILLTLDERIQHVEDRKYWSHFIKPHLIYLQRMYLVVYTGIGFFASLAFIVRREQKLFYNGWLPFNWHQTWWHYSVALGYQFYGIFFQFLQNFANDSFSPKALCALSGHIKLLYKRVARIGYDLSVVSDEHEMELNRCVRHQKDLYELFDTIQEIISWPIFFQLFVSLANMCVAMVALLFFVTDIFYRIYYVMYFLGMIMQLFPVCYYGSDFVMLFEKLHYAVFSCNWTGQSKRFKRHMMLFTERSLKNTMALAGGIFPIHLTTFFATCKGAYSMFAVVITMK